MTDMADKKQTIKKLRELFEKKRTAEELQEQEPKLYRTLYKGLEDVNGLDYEYLDNFRKIKGENYSEKIGHVNDFSFKDCCTLLTFILRAERFSDGFFYNAVSNGDVSRVLKRTKEIMDE